MFSLRQRTIRPLQKHLVIADATNEPHKEFTSRFCRHFTQINLPSCEESLVRSIYSTLIRTIVNKTKCSEEFKGSYDLELDRVIDYILRYMRINNEAYNIAYY